MIQHISGADLSLWPSDIGDSNLEYRVFPLRSIVLENSEIRPTAKRASTHSEENDNGVGDVDQSHSASPLLLARSCSASRKGNGGRARITLSCFCRDCDLIR